MAKRWAAAAMLATEKNFGMLLSPLDDPLLSLGKRHGRSVGFYHLSRA
jgi:hypothetical protein